MHLYHGGFTLVWVRFFDSYISCSFGSVPIPWRISSPHSIVIDFKFFRHGVIQIIPPPWWIFNVLSIIVDFRFFHHGSLQILPSSWRILSIFSIIVDFGSSYHSDLSVLTLLWQYFISSLRHGRFRVLSLS